MGVVLSRSVIMAGGGGLERTPDKHVSLGSVVHTLDGKTNNAVVGS